MHNRGLLLFLFGLSFLAICGCQAGNFPGLSTTLDNGPETVPVRLVVTDDFGHHVLLDEAIEAEAGDDALDCLLQVASVKTAYGGGFVTAIEGITSGYLSSPVTRKDWFVYINGVLANTGGLGYTVQPGDTVCWYYRDWSFRQSISALAGGCLQFLSNGYQGQTRPTWIIYQPQFQQHAASLANRFTAIGVENVACVLIDNIAQADMQQDNIVLVGSNGFAPLTEINDHWDKLGLYCQFRDSGLQVFDYSGKPVQHYEETTGVILALQNPFNPRGTGACENVCLVVTGTDEAGIQSAVEILIQKPHELGFYAGAFVYERQVRPLP